MKTQDSISIKGISYDVYNGNLASEFRIVEAYMQEIYNMGYSEPTIRAIENITVEGTVYTLCESYYDSGSVDYYYFAVK